MSASHCKGTYAPEQPQQVVAVVCRLCVVWSMQERNRHRGLCNLGYMAGILRPKLSWSELPISQTARRHSPCTLAAWCCGPLQRILVPCSAMLKTYDPAASGT